MATSRSFQDMLNDHLVNDLFKEEFVKRSWLFENIEKDDTWKGGTLPVPFKGSQASSVTFGALESESDIAEDVYVRGEVTTCPEVWGALLFKHRDLMEQDGKVNEDSFLKMLPDMVNDFTDYMKNVVGMQLMNGDVIAKLTSDGDSSGNAVVDRVERFVLKQKVYVDDDNSSTSAAGYVQSIVLDTNTITLDTTRAGGSDLNIAAYTVAQNAKVYWDGCQPGVALGFASLKSMLLSSTNGGGSTLYGQTKTAYPYLQSINKSGSDITAVNILEKIFDAYTDIKNKGKGMPDKIVVSYKHLGSIMKVLEAGKGAYHVDQTGTKVSAYGWTEIVIYGVKGRITVVGCQEIDDDFIPFLDLSALKFHSNGLFKKRVAPDGKHYFELRATTGYSYIVDMCLFGQLILNQPTKCGIIHSISY